MSDAGGRLHPDMVAALRQVRALSLYEGDRTVLAPQRQRDLMEAERRWWNEGGPEMDREWCFELDGPLRRVPVMAMAPPGAAPGRPWIVWMHGGGWVLGSPATHAALMRGLAAASGCIVLAPDYALAPEHRFPAPVLEVQAVLQQLIVNAERLGLEPGRMVVGGDSSGANLALAAALQLQRAHPGSIRCGVFHYGVFDDELDDEACRTFGAGEHGLGVARMRWYWDCYAPDPASRADERVNLQRADLGAAFPMYLTAAECDILGGGAARFAARLTDAGVDCELRWCRGMGHAFMGYGRIVGEVARVHAQAAAFIHRMAGHGR